MSSREIQFAVQGVLQQRAQSEFNLPELEPTALAQFIHQNCSIEESKAVALAWGEKVSFNSEELNRVADCFAVHGELLSALLNSASEETLEHILYTIAATLNAHECPVCAELREAILNNTEGILDLSLLVLAHVVEDQQMQDEEFLEDDAELLDALIGIFPQLDKQAQIRVLGFACQEAGSAAGDSGAVAFRAYSRLRQGYLSLLARRVFDQLTLSPSGSMSAEELALALNLNDKRALGQVKRNVQRAFLNLSREGLELEEMPLRTERIGRDRIFTLSDEARQSWKALLQAETNHLLNVEGLA